MALKALVGQKVIDDVIKSVHTPGKWKVLVVDKLAMRVISTCCKMRDIVMQGVTIVEDLSKGRESLSLEAIYFVSPTENSVQAILDDFKDAQNPRYLAAHIFFTEACPGHLFESIAKSSTLGRRIKNLKEINISYLPVEMQVFSLDASQALALLYSHNPAVIRDKMPGTVEQIAEQLATLCASLGEYPSIRYRSASQLSLDIAQAALNKLNAYKADYPSMGEGPEKGQSQLIILDRGFDLVSPLLHELTYQAMAYDLLNIHNDVYKYEVQSGPDYIQKEALLDENDDLWISLRHKHIANVSKDIPNMIKEFQDSKRISGVGSSSSNKPISLKDLGIMLKKMPQYQKELSKYSLHLNLAEECLHVYKNDQIEKLCAVEQDLATGVDKDGEKISKDHMRAIVPVLLDTDISENNKIRIILLYAIMKQGINEESMNKLMEHAKISSAGRNMIRNVSNLDVAIIQDGNKKKSLPVRKDRTEDTYQLSRYVPYAKDIMEDIIEQKLDDKIFPYLMKCEGGGLLSGATSARSARRGHWHKDKSPSDMKSLPRVIVFIVGGCSYSEIRCSYEVTKANKGWEVLVGGTELLTPEGFLYNILSLD